MQPNEQTNNQTVAEALISGMAAAFPREHARANGVHYWPDPLPTPDPGRTPDPLVLFALAEAIMERTQPQPLVPQLRAVLATRSQTPTDSLTPIPLGLVDLPNEQRQEPLLVDLQGTPGTLSGGPLLIAGSQGSGKATALQTMLLWLAAVYPPQALQVAIIDPAYELSALRGLPHVLRDAQGTPQILTSEDDDAIEAMSAMFTNVLQGRHNARGKAANEPLLLLVVSQLNMLEGNYGQTRTRLRELVLAAAKERALGVFTVITTEMVNSQIVPDDFLARMGTRLRLVDGGDPYTFFGLRTHDTPAVAGRGAVLRRDRVVREVQVALPFAGATESERERALVEAVNIIAHA